MQEYKRSYLNTAFLLQDRNMNLHRNKYSQIHFCIACIRIEGLELAFAHASAAALTSLTLFPAAKG
jgi:hypothetical protein